LTNFWILANIFPVKAIINWTLSSRQQAASASRYGVSADLKTMGIYVVIPGPIERDLHLSLRPLAFAAQPWPLYPQFAVRKENFAL